jgi:hypothetical protein
MNNLLDSIEGLHNAEDCGEAIDCASPCGRLSFLDPEAGSEFSLVLATPQDRHLARGIHEAADALGRHVVRDRRGRGGQRDPELMQALFDATH